MSVSPHYRLDEMEDLIEEQNQNERFIGDKFNNIQNEFNDHLNQVYMEQNQQLSEFKT